MPPSKILKRSLPGGLLFLSESNLFRSPCVGDTVWERKSLCSARLYDSRGQGPPTPFCYCFPAQGEAESSRYWIHVLGWSAKGYRDIRENTPNILKSKEFLATESKKVIHSSKSIHSSAGTTSAGVLWIAIRLDLIKTFAIIYYENVP